MNTVQRKDQVLSSIVELYIQTGEPVGSKAVSSKLNDMCSSATIRNDMCDLIDRGYLIQPHTSAGRIPSANGFRYYIENLMPAYTLSQQSCERILGFLPRFCGDVERYIADVAKSLAKMTGCTAMITTPISHNATLKRMEVLQMGPTSVLIAVLTSAGLMKSKLCQLDVPVSPKELEQFTHFINERFSDIRLSQITPAMAQTLAISFGSQALQFAPLLEQIFEAAQESVRTTLHLEGQPNLLLYKEFSPASVIELFARKDSLLSYLNRAQDTTVYLGHEFGDEALRNASLIVTDYTLKGDLKGKIAVLGPMKNDYRSLIPTLEFVAKAAGQNLSLYI